jgi:hypothetical protein
MNFDRHRFVSLETFKVLFPDELDWMRANRWKLMELYPEFVSLLGTGQFSFYHISKVKEEIDKEQAEKSQSAAEAAKKHRIDPRSLTGDHRS